MMPFKGRMFNNYICALDIGHTKIAAVVAEKKRGHLNALFCESVPAKGLKRGSIVDSISVLGCIDRLLKNIRAKSGIGVKYIYTNVSGEDILTKHSYAVMPLAERGNKVIGLSDISQVNEQARILGSSLEEEIIHEIALSYDIDSNSNVTSPLGLYSHKLGIDLYLLCARISFLQGVTRLINQAGCEIRGLFFSGLATSEAVFSGEDRKGINVLCDIGGDITEVVIFKDGLLREVRVLSCAGEDLVTALANRLNISPELAWDIIRSHGLIGEYSQMREDREILVKREGAYQPISQKLVSEIITARANNIASEIKECVEKITPCSRINNFITTGRAVLTEGFLEILENTLEVPVRLGRVKNPIISHLASRSEELAGGRHLTYLTCLGIICKVMNRQELGSPTSSPVNRNFISNVTSKIKAVYQEYF
ncbi:MAG: cell division FtsA domain-containing protein [Candidatus Omnitrophota bacterium]